MADFPSAIYAPRTIENRPGVVYDANDTKTFFAEDHEQVTGEVVAIENALGANLANLGLNGWLSLATIPTLQASDDPVYTLRFASDMTAILAVGQKIKLTQHGSVKYFIIVSVGAYTGGNTDVDVYGGTDYDMENTTTYPVTLPYYSISHAPAGFPLSPLKWTFSLTDTSRRTQATPTQNTWYNVGSLSLAIPKGLWKVRYSARVSCDNDTAATQISVTLSTANNSESDNELSGYLQTGSVQADVIITMQKILSLSSKTTYYVNIRTIVASISNIELRNDVNKLIVEAVCAYL